MEFESSNRDKDVPEAKLNIFGNNLSQVNDDIYDWRPHMSSKWDKDCSGGHIKLNMFRIEFESSEW